MEASSRKSVQIEGVNCSLPGTSTKNDAATESNSAEVSDTTKTILEDVCMDFESMDVVCPNKTGVKKSINRNSPLQSSGDKINKPAPAARKVVPPEKTVIVDREVVEDVISSELQLDAIQPSEVNLPLDQIQPIVSETMQYPIVTSADSPAFYTASQVLPLNDCQDPGGAGITILPESAVKNLSSLAQLADAEIVQSGDSVSIFVTNTRLINVLTNPDNSVEMMQSAAVIDPSAAGILETDMRTAQPISIVDHELIPDSIFPGMHIEDDSNVIQETVITERESANSSTAESKTKPRIGGCSRGRPPSKRPFEKVYSGPVSTIKSRRVTAKMKTEWARQLQENGHLMCQTPGCSQTYVTVANFTTHFKYCSGKGSLQVCMHCQSLIFSTRKAMLQHMEVEHPEHVEEFKANYPEEESSGFEEGDLAQSVMLPESDVAMNVEEVTQKSPKKHKLSYKENVSAHPKRAILKHKIQSIQNSMAENAKEFKKCVRFDNIVDKINSIDSASHFEVSNFEGPTGNNSLSMKPKDKRKKVFFAGSIVAEKKYFEDEEDAVSSLKMSSQQEEEESKEDLFTKAKMVLNKERYKRYKEYLKLTRDWSSERKTYSRGRGSDVSSDCSFTLQSQNESVEDVHQLNETAESSSISLNTTEAEISSLEMPSLQILDNAPQSVSFVTAESETLVHKSVQAANCPPILVNELSAQQEFLSFVEKNSSPDSKMRRDKTCYGRASLEAAKLKQPVKLKGIITYGLQVPGEVSKPVMQEVSFDSLVESLKPKPVRISGQTYSEIIGATTLESIPKPVKEEKVEISPPKRKRGRPPKIKPESPANIKDGKKNKINEKKNAQKYGTAMLKSIEKNVTNRKIKLFGVKRNSKFKSQSKKYVSQLVGSKNSSLKNNKSKRSLIAKNIINRKKSVKAKTIDESAIQCQENIDNHLLLGNESDASNIQCLPVDHTYTHASVVEDHLGTNASTVVEEIEITTTNADNASYLVVAEENDKSSKNTLVNSVSTELLEALPKTLAHQNSEETPEMPPVNRVGDKRENDVDNDLIDGNYSKCIDSLGLPKNDQEITFAPLASAMDAVALTHQNSVLSLPPENISLHQLADREVGEISTESESPAAELEPPNTSVLMKEGELAQEVDARCSQRQPPPVVENLSTSQKTVELVIAEHSIVKKRRGRPRKNAIPVPVSEKTKAKSPRESTPVSRLDRSKTLSATDSQLEVDTTHSMNDDSKGTPGIRKSERVKRRKLVDEQLFLASPIETRPKVETTPPVRTGRRGRPRKYPLKESPDLDSSGSTLGEEPVLQKLHGAVTKSESADGSLRKFSRKGRPRKCVRYADLNTGLDSSESMDGLSGTCMGKDQKVEGGKAAKGKCVEKTPGVGEEKKMAEQSQNGPTTQEENIILPLKKRKQRQSKKDDVLVENSSVSKSDTSHDVPLSDGGENENSQKKDLTLLKNSSNLRQRKGSKRKCHERVADTSDEDWDPNKHTPRSSRRKMLSNQEHLSMEEESSDSSSSEKNDSTVGFKKSSRKVNETSANQKFAIERVKNLERSALKYSLKISESILTEHKPQIRLWKLLSNEDYCTGLPPLKHSAFYKIENIWEKKEAYWNSLSLFDSAPVDENSSHCTFFTGGPVLSASWCPIPLDKKVQYIALATSFALNEVNSYLETRGERGLLQLWNAGVLSDKRMESKPVMELSIAYNYGPVTDMEWCPSGCWEDPLIECADGNLPRLGMLALACADSNVRIYSIPHPQFLPKETTYFPIYSACPSIILEPMYGDICGVTRKSMCISLSWQKSDNYERIAAGYGNGMICIWHITSSATILAIKENSRAIINPYLVFNAHGTPVTSVSFSPVPHGRYLVSSGIDKTMKYWDLIDTSLPLFTVKKGSGKSVEWASHYCGAFATVDHGMNSTKGSSFFKECGTENFQSRTVSLPCAAVMKTSMSEWLNAQALSDMSGVVSVTFIQNLLQDHMKTPSFFQRPVYMSELQLVEGIVEKILFSSYPESKICTSALREMVEVTSVLNKLIEMCCEVKHSDLNSAKQLVKAKELEFSVEEMYSEESESVGCLSAIEEMKEVVDKVHEIVENSLTDDDTQPVSRNEFETSNNDNSGENKLEEIMSEGKLSEMTEIVILVDDVAYTVDHLPRDSVQSECFSLELVIDDSLMEEDKCSSVSDEEKQSSVFLTENSVENVETQNVSELLCHLIDSVEQEMASSQKVQNSDECISTLESITSVVSVVEGVVENCDWTIDPAEVKLNESETTESKKTPTFRSGFTYDSLSDMTDVISAVEDLRDTTGVLSDVQEVVSFTSALREVVASVCDMKDVTAVMDKLKSSLLENQVLPLKFIVRNFLSQIDVESNISESDAKIGDQLVHETSVALRQMIKSVSEEVDMEQVVKDFICTLVTHVERQNQFMDRKARGILSDNASVPEKENTEKTSLPLNTRELISTAPSVDPSTESENVTCCSPVALSFDYELESVDDESSISENDMDTDDELEMSNSYVFDQDSNFSGDSILSECSLDSSISMCSSSGISNISEVSSSSAAPGELDIGQPICNAPQNVATNDENSYTKSHRPFNLAMEEEKTSGEFSLGKCTATESLNVESLSGDVITQEQIQISQEVEMINVTLLDSNAAHVPDSKGEILPESNMDPLSIEPCETGNGEESTASKNASSPASEVPTELVRDSVTICSNNLEEAVFLEIDPAAGETTQTCTDTQDPFPVVDQTCVVSSVLVETEVNDNTCTKDTLVNDTNFNAGETHLESILPVDSLPSTVSEMPQTIVSSADSGSRTESNEAVGLYHSCNNFLLSKKFSSHEDVVSEYGIVFKDMNTSHFESIPDNNNVEDTSATPLDHYHLTSIKTVTWNPNLGSHFWLLSAGQSGLARISYISDINQPNTSEKRNANDA